MSLRTFAEAVAALASGRRMTIDDIAAHAKTWPDIARGYVRELQSAGLVTSDSRRRNALDNRTSREYRWTGPVHVDAPLVEWTPIEPDPLLTQKQAAARIGITDYTLRKWLRLCPERISHVRQGRFIRFRKSAVDEFLRGGA